MKLSTKLFLSHTLVIVVGMLVLIMVVAWIAPVEFEHRMMGGGNAGGMRMGQHMTTLAEDLQINFRAAIQTALFSAVAVGIVVAALSSWLLSRRIVKPIRSVVQSSHTIADGHYDQRLEKQSNDELGELIDSFNRMANALSQTENMRRQLLADVTHELKTPLASIKGYVEALEDGVMPATPETFQTIHDEASRLQRLVQDLSELSLVESGQITLHPEKIPLQEFLRDLIHRMFATFSSKQIHVDMQIADGLDLFADRDRTAQILTNLLANAAQYTPDGGWVKISAIQAGAMAEIRVQDSGIGISASDLPHLFQRFFRADRSRARRSGGSGIGLTITRHLVEAQGGTIRAESPGVGQGSTFIVLLPQ
jgi:histidine kinase